MQTTFNPPLKETSLEIRIAGLKTVEIQDEGRKENTFIYFLSSPRSEYLHLVTCWAKSRTISTPLSALHKMRMHRALSCRSLCTKPFAFFSRSYCGLPSSRIPPCPGSGLYFPHGSSRYHFPSWRVPLFVGQPLLL